jgi:signal transduction histidine kinase/ligand-binding sensor domain-containing protein
MAFAKHIVAAIISLIATSIAGQSLAQSSVEQINGFTHTVWSTRDGMPDDIESMAQTPDGWIWLAAQSHLYRFDGVTPELVDIPSADTSELTAVFATSSGDLWLGYASGHVLMLPEGDFRRPRIVRGSNITSPIAFLQDKQGDVWAYNFKGLYKVNRLEWHRVGEESGVYGDHILSVQMDTEGTIWVFSNEGVFTLADRHTRFEKRMDLPSRLNGQRSASNYPSTVTYGDTYLSIYMANSGKKTLPTFFESRYNAISDSSGAFWLITISDGVRRAASPDSTTLANLAASLRSSKMVDSAVWPKLSSSYAHTALEDRQHNIWVSTTLGLERFRPSIATTLKLPSGDFAYTMLPGNNGSIWFGTALSAHAYRWWHVDSSITPAAGYDMDTTVAYRDTDGSILLGTGDGFVRRFVDGKFQSVDPLPPGAENGNDIIAIVRDEQQKLWISIRGHTTFQFNNGRWIVNGGFDQLPTDRWALRAVNDARGRLWLSYRGGLFIIDGQHVTRYAGDAGMDIPYVCDIVTEGIPLIGGDAGLAAFDGQRFHRISALDASALTGITGIVRLKDGTVWLNGHEGGVRINAGELARALKDADYKVPLRVFGEDDGMPGTAQKNRPVPSLIEGTDGRLWFADTKGIAWLDPAKIPEDQADPTVVIRSITVGNESYRPDSVPMLPAGTRNIQIDYTVIGLSNTAEARFRYELAGVDTDWQDVGARRQAFYANLGPGIYEFRVSSTNEDGAWTRATAHINFTIKPEFYQTKWFLILGIGLVLALLWIAYIYHLRQLTQRLRQRLEDRHAERDRIARELHDTYLQTVHGLVLTMRALSHELPEGSARNKILSALDTASLALVEGRNRVYALRAGAIHNVDLVVAFKAVAQEFKGDSSPLFNVTSAGAAKAVDPLVIDELYASGREAIVNAFQHSSAKAIRVDVCYDKKGMRVEVVDDGKGIDPQIIQEGGIPGHWGLRGIRERMGRIGGRCHITGNEVGGTKVVLFVAAHRAYANR